MKITIIIILFFVVIVGGCIVVPNIIGAKRASEYSGEGTLKYLKAPLLGISGWTLELSHFDMSKGIDKSYSLAGLPEGKLYMVRLVVKDPCPLDEVKKGNFSFRLTNGQEIIRELPSTSISQMINSYDTEKNKFWYYNENSQQPDSVWEYSFNVTKARPALTLSVSIHNKSLGQPVEAYVLVERGGYR